MSQYRTTPVDSSEMPKGIPYIVTNDAAKPAWIVHKLTGFSIMTYPIQRKAMSTEKVGNKGTSLTILTDKERAKFKKFCKHGLLKPCFFEENRDPKRHIGAEHWPFFLRRIDSKHGPGFCFIVPEQGIKTEKHQQNLSTLKTALRFANDVYLTFDDLTLEGKSLYGRAPIFIPAAHTLHPISRSHLIPNQFKNLLPYLLVRVFNLNPYCSLLFFTKSS